MEYPARPPLCSRTACPRSCSPLLRPPCGGRHTNLRARASIPAPFGNGFPEATFRVAPTPSITAVIATATFHGPPPPSPLSETREASVQLRRHGALSAVDDDPFGLPQCGYHVPVSLCESYSPDALRGQGSLGTRSPSFARVSFPDAGRTLRHGFRRAGGTIPWLSRRRTARPLAGYAGTLCRACEHSLVSRPRTHRLLFTVAANR